MKKLTILALTSAMVAGTPAMADLVFPSLSYRTGPYAAGGIPFADGYADYMTLLNERDGGIGGVMTNVIECETAYNTERGVECYESTRGEGALVYQPLSTGITYQLIPRTTADGIPLHTMGYGRTSAANGNVFSHTFNYPANYWDAASVIVNQLLEENDGSLEGQTIALLYHNSAYGREPIRTLETLAAQHGFEFTQIAVDHPGQEQGNQWLQIRRERPDYVVMWGWGVMNQVAIQEAINIRYPMENFIGNWWSGADHDVESAGADAAGYRSLNMNRLGDMPVFAEIQEHVHDAGLAAGDGSGIGWHARFEWQDVAMADHLARGVVILGHGIAMEPVPQAFAFHIMPDGAELFWAAPPQIVNGLDSDFLQPNTHALTDPRQVAQIQAVKPPGQLIGAD